MKGGVWRRTVALVTSLVCIALIPLAASEPTVTIEPYTKDEFPGWLQDLRRAEIVSLGSLPFVTMGVTFAYSIYRYFVNDMNSDYFPNPFAKSSSAARLSTDEQLGILFTSLGLAAAVGVTDFTISSVQRHLRNKALEEQNRSGVEIIPLDDSLQSEEALPLEPMDSDAMNSHGLDDMEGTKQVQPPLVQSKYKEFFPFGLFVVMPQFHGVYLDA